MKKIVLLAASIGLIGVVSSEAAVTFTGTTLVYDFNDYEGSSGPAGWDAHGFNDGPGFSENRLTSNGGVTQGGTYAFQVSTGNYALGVQPGGDDFTPGYYQLQIVNNSGSLVNEWAIAFKSFVYNDQPRGNSFNFSWSTNGTDFTNVAAGSFTSLDAADASPSWLLMVDFSDVISASVADGGSLYLRWSGDDVSGSSNRDEFALDDVSVGSLTPAPEPSAALLGVTGLAAMLLRRRRQA